jgi:peptidoglycan/LPS O-acetylase OafA/YrhL
VINIFKKIDISNVRRISFRNDITGLRAIAVLSVVFYHADFTLFKGGWLGVDMFFVLSGYLITNIILSELNEEKFSFKIFYIRRIRRILPALTSTILITIPFAYWLLTPKAMAEYVDSAFSSIFFYANLYFQNLDFYNAESTSFMPLLHTWSLAVEEQFYILFPLFCFVIYRMKKYFLLLLSAAFLYSIYLNSTTNYLTKFYQIQFRAWELLIGGLVMILSQKLNLRHSEKIGITFTLFSLFYFDDNMLTLNSLEPKLVAVFGVSLILLSKDKTFIQDVLENKFLKFFGLISYSLYLLHQPFFAYLKIGKLRYDLEVSPIFDFILLLLLVILSFISWKYVEIYFQKASLKKLSFFLVGSIILILLFINVSNRTDGYKFRYDYVPENVLSYARNNNLYTNPTELTEFNNFCSEVKNKDNLLIIGDSHINTFTYTLVNEFKNLSCQFNVRYIMNPEGRCLLSAQTDIVGDVFVCSDEHFDNFIQILNEEPYIVLAIGRYDTWLNETKGGNEVKCDNCDFEDVFYKRMMKISNYAEKFIIVDPVPTYPMNIAESYIFKKVNWGSDITIELSNWIEYINPTKEFLNNIDTENLLRIFPEDVLCSQEENKCYASKEFDLYYSDDNHLTVEGNKLLINHIISELNIFLLK